MEKSSFYLLFCGAVFNVLKGTAVVLGCKLYKALGALHQSELYFSSVLNSLQVGTKVAPGLRLHKGRSDLELGLKAQVKIFGKELSSWKRCL